jgi:hypothetical protein
MIYLGVILAVALLIVAIVMVGMRGRGKSHAPRLSSFFAKTAMHLNGDAEPPEGLVDFFDKLPMPTHDKPGDDSEQSH